MKRVAGGWLLSVAPLLVVVGLFGRFLAWVEMRPGVVLDDPILARLPPMELAWPIFTLIYGLMLSAAYLCWNDRRRITFIMRAYALLTLFRMTAMYLAPLERPLGMILLRDPFVEIFMGGEVLTKDLFFSGHTSFLFLLSLSMPAKRERAYFFTGTAFVAGMLLAQHAHYSVDVFAAPFFSYAAYALTKRFTGGPRD